MSQPAFAFCLGLCKRATAIAIIFSSLICSAWAQAPAGDPVASAQGESGPLAAAILNSMQSRATAWPPYTITGDANRTVLPGTYSSIIVDSPNASANHPDIEIGAGTVILTGENGPMFNVGSDKVNKVQLNSTDANAPAILWLESGAATGTIGVGPSRSTSSTRDSILYIGDGSEGTDLPTVTITGNINGIGRSYIVRYKAESLLETRGANLVVNGSISDNQAATMLRNINAYNGNVETNDGDETTTSPGKFDIIANGVNLKSGNHVSAAVDFMAASITLPADSYIYAANRLDVINTIGAEGSDTGGSMSLGSKLQAGKMLVLRGGIARAAGQIISDTRSILSHDTEGSKNVETPQRPILQGGDDPLNLQAAQDILPGDVDVESMKSGRDIVAGTITFRAGSTGDPSGVLPGRYCLNSGDAGYSYPRSTVRANTVEVEGRLLAGELILPRADNKKASLSAGNLWVTKAPKVSGFDVSTGNFTLDNGSFALKNPDNIQLLQGLENTSYKEVTFDRASIVEGKMTATHNGDSSFTTLRVGETAYISGGSLTGSELEANVATFENVTGTTISRSLSVATDLTSTGNGKASVAMTTVGGTSSVDGGSWSGASFTAASASFTDSDGVTLSDSLKSTSGNVEIAGPGKSDIASTVAAQDFSLNGGSFRGGSIESGRDATFANASEVTLETTTVGGDFTAQNNASAAFGTLKTGGGVTVTGGDFQATSVATGTDATRTGDFTASGATYDLGSGSHIQGNMEAANSSGKFSSLTVASQLTMSGGYLEGDALHAESGVFSKKSTANIDNLTLTGNALTLNIEAGSRVIVQTINDRTGTELVKDGGLIILGSGSSTLDTINLQDGNFEAGAATVHAGDVVGSGQSEGDNLWAHQLLAQRIEVEDASLRLTGLGDYASSVDGYLSIEKNRDTTLGDVTVVDIVNVAGGTISARQLTAKSDAAFSGTDVTLYGTGDKASSIAGNLTVASNNASSLGDVTVGLKAELSGGTLTAHNLTAGSAALSGGLAAEISSLTISDPAGSLEVGSETRAASLSAHAVTLQGAPLNVHADSTVEVNSSGPEETGSLTAGAINIYQAGQVRASGAVRADSALLGENAVLTGASVAIAQNLAEMGGGAISSTSGDVTLAGGATDARGKISSAAGIVAGQGESYAAITGSLALTAQKNIDAADIAASSINARGNVTAHAGSVNITGEGSAIGGDLTISRNANSNLGKELKVGGAVAVTGGELAAGSLTAGSAALDGGAKAQIAELALDGQNSFLAVGKSGEDPASLTAGHLSLGHAPMTVAGASVVNVTSQDGVADSGQISGGAIEIPETGQVTAQGEISADSLKMGQGALTGASVTIDQAITDMQGGAITATAGDVTLAGGAKKAIGSISAPQGAILAGQPGAYERIGGALDLSAMGNIEASELAVRTVRTETGDVIAYDGSVNLTGQGSSIGGNLAAARNVTSSLGSLRVGGETSFAGGSLKAETLTTGSARLDNVKAEIDSLILSPGADGRVAVTNSGKDPREVQVNTLALNGGALDLAASTPTPVRMFVQEFASAGNLVNGHIGVARNGVLVLGAGNADIMNLPAAIDSDARGVFALAAPMRLDSRFGIHITGQGSANPVAGLARFDASSLFVIDSQQKKAVYAYLGSVGSLVPSAQLSASNGAQGALSASSAMPAQVSNGAQIYIRNPQVNTVIVALGENINTLYADKVSRAASSEDAPWTGGNLDYDNKDEVRITRLEDEYAGQFLVLPAANPEPELPQPPVPPAPGTPDPGAPPAPGQPGTPETHPNVHPSIGNVIDKGKDDGTIGTQPHHLAQHNGAGFISHTLTHDSPHEATRILESSSRLVVLGAVPQIALTANNAAHAAVAQRASSLLWRSDEIRERSYALWAVPLYFASSGWGLEAGAHNYDFQSGIGGLAIGADATFEDRIRAGIAFNIGAGYAQSSGDLIKTTNNMDFWGLGVYAAYALGNFGLTADFNFTSSFNSLKQDVPGLPDWQELKSDVQAQALGTALELQYRFDLGFADLAPHAGFKYNYVHVDDYDVTDQGHTIIKGRAFDQNVWTFPVGLRLSRDFYLDNGWVIKPRLDLRATPAAGDIDVKTHSRYTGTSSDIELDTQVMDSVTWGGSAGLEATLGSFSLGVKYRLDAGAHSFGNAVFGTLRYEF